ncbi:MAG TPA: hypothetical protein VF755_27235 [Catenuloplanes sp.]
MSRTGPTAPPTAHADTAHADTAHLDTGHVGTGVDGPVRAGAGA